MVADRLHVDDDCDADCAAAQSLIRRPAIRYGEESVSCSTAL
jgi:hypothetical protein